MLIQPVFLKKPLLAACISWGLHGLVGAQALTPLEPVLPATGATTQFKISAFELKGDNPLSADDSKAILAPFVQHDATLVTLQKATAALEESLKSKGFPLHRVSLPPQDLGDKVTLVIVKFVIGKVTTEGNKYFTDDNIRASVPELRPGEAPNFTKLAVQTAISNESPAKQLQVSLKESEEADKIDVKLIVKEAQPWGVAASLSNTGSDSTGQERFTLVGNHANLWGRDHQFSGAYTTSPERTGDVKQIGLNYRVPLYELGGVLGLSYTQSDVVGNFGAFTSTGAGQTYGFNYSHYIAPVAGWRTYISFALDEKIFNANRANNGPLALGQPALISSRPFSVGYSARVESDAALWGFNADLAFNLPGGSGNNLTDYQTANAGSAAPDLRISTVSWKALRGGANYLTAFANGWLWSLRGQFQYSPEALISGEQFGIGGSSSVRGTTERPISGDSGVFASMELSTPEWQQGLRGVGFIDGGWVNYNGAAPVGSDQLLSVGLGLRFTKGDYGFNLDWGRILSGSVVPLATNPRPPQSGDEKIHLNISAKF
jgi:hemolysin activation/secretion protein